MIIVQEVFGKKPLILKINLIYRKIRLKIENYMKCDYQRKGGKFGTEEGNRGNGFEMEFGKFRV